MRSRGVAYPGLAEANGTGCAVVRSVAAGRRSLPQAYGSRSIRPACPSCGSSWGRAWQFEGVGERHIAELLSGRSRDRARRLVDFGVAGDVAEAMAPDQDESMQRSILACTGRLRSR